MATIESTIKLNDQMSAKVQQITQALGGATSACVTFNTQINNTTNNIKNISGATKSAESGLDSLASKVRGVIAALGGLAAVNKVINISDDLTSMNARLGMVATNFGLVGEQADAFTQSIYNAANASRGTFDSMASLVARLGTNAKDAFNTPDELLQFAEAVQKEMTLGGASTQEAENAMLQLLQALASGVLRGDELNSIFEQAPNLIQDIADYMGVNIGEIRSLASEGQITTDIVKNALLDALNKTDGINAKFAQMPMTFGQAMAQIQNYALQAFTPVLNQMNEMLNSATGQAMLTDAMNLIAAAASVASDALTLFGQALQFVYDNISSIASVIAVVVGSMTLYNAMMALGSALTTVFGVAHTIATAFVTLYANAVNSASAAVMAFNRVLAACPLNWILIAIVAVVAVVYLFAQSIAESGGVAQNTFSVICGWISVVIGWFQNLWVNAQIVATNIGIAISNGCAVAQTAFYALMYAAMSCIAAIAQALNAIPGISFDTSGLEAAANSYASKAETAGNKVKNYKDYVSFDSAAAYNKGATWGNNKSNAASTLANKLKNLGSYSGGAGTGAGSAAAQTAANTGKTAGNTGKTAGNTGKIASTLEDTQEDLKYLVDIAERDAINRFTTASIAVDMVNNNTISSGMDLDTIVDGLTSRLQTSMAMIAEGA